MENKKDEKDCVECGNETVGYMLQIMGHELRNPTTVVGGLATQLYEKITEEDEGCGYVMSEMDIVKLKIINEEARHALKIMAIFDAFVRKPIFERETNDLHNVIRRVITIRPDRRVKIREDFNLKREVFVDVARMSFSLLNIINNAKDAVIARINTIQNYQGEIIIKTGDNGDCFFISIKNNGMRIPNEIIDKITQRSFTTKDNGTGFGLTFAGDVIRQHGGYLEIKSEEDSTEFTIFIPF